MPSSSVRNGARRASRATAVPSSPERVEAERIAASELEAWRASTMPDPSASFDADALAGLVRDCYAALGIDPDVGASFSVNTVHFYRRKDILDEPAGRTSAARYDIRHLWQAIGARLAGHLGLVTLAEAREAIRGADQETLLAFVAARVVDARAREQMRSGTPRATPGVAAQAAYEPAVRARPLPGVNVTATRDPGAAEVPPAQGLVIPLPGEAWCIVPASHPAHYSSSSARELVYSLAAALRVPLR